MLYQGDPSTLVPWARSWAMASLDHLFSPGTTGSIAVRCRIGEMEEEEFALLDTGATWSIIGPEIAEQLREENLLGESLGEITVSTRYGPIGCSLHRIPVLLVADKGASLLVDATCAVSDEWPGPMVIGFHCFLEVLNLAIEPGIANSQEPGIYFGRP